MLDENARVQHFFPEAEGGEEYRVRMGRCWQDSILLCCRDAPAGTRRRRHTWKSGRRV
jgi:hypothetical protein